MIKELTITFISGLVAGSCLTLLINDYKVRRAKLIIKKREDEINALVNIIKKLEYDIREESYKIMIDRLEGLFLGEGKNG